MSAPTTKSLGTDAVWLITGCSSGLGKAIAQTVYNAGHQVVATARNTNTLSYLPDDARVLKLRLDVTSKASIVEAVEASVKKFGRLDVAINNAGYGLVGDAEVIPEEDARQLLETLFWGPAFLMQEVVRVFRDVNPAGRGGTIVNISSMGGSVAVAGNSFYHAGKFALEGFTKTIAQEMRPEWNIRCLIVAPGGVMTKFAGSDSNLKTFPRHPAYDIPSHPTTQLLNYLNVPGITDTFSKPETCAQLLFDTIAGKFVDRSWPTRLLMGVDAFQYVKKDLERTLEEVEVWKAESVSCSPNQAVDLSQLGL